ncbi:MAG TPA: PP2C family protein-serine/threonine phosphatase, partial [Acidimicrobiales bacterium]
MDDQYAGPLLQLVPGARLAGPDEVPGLVDDAARKLGADGAVIYVVDHEQLVLRPVPGPTAGQETAVDTTVAGRAFRTTSFQQSVSGGVRRVWVPLLDGLERLGALELRFPADAEVPDDETLLQFEALVADLVLTKGQYGDLFEVVRRRQPMSLATELTRQALPPLTFGTPQVVVTAVLTPAYDVGGDTFDYAVDGQTARVAIFDAMGHGLQAGLMSTVAVAAYRHSRRQGLDLEATASAIDLALGTQFGPERFVTAVIAELDLASGRLRWVLHGHPEPLLLRHDKVVKRLGGNTRPPLGLGVVPEVAEESLEPGDSVLLFTDGVVEARSADGEFFGVDRLADLVARESRGGNPPPETMRRLVQAILTHQAGDLQDDATTVMVGWRTRGAERTR